MTIIHLFYAVLILLLAGPHMAQAQDTPPACTPVAVLFGETLCREELKPDDPALIESMKNLSPEKKRDFLDKTRTRNLRKMKAMIWRHALAHKFEKDVLTPTREEVEAYREAFNRSMKQSYEADRKTKEIIESALAGGSYGAAHDKTLRDLLKAVTISIEFYEQREKHAASLPPDYKFVTEDAERQIAQGMVAGWKADRLLYETYGGRLIVMPDGPVPVDAYSRFLDYIRTDGKLEIRDPDFKDALKETDDLVAAPHDALPATDPIAQNYFKSPEWSLSLGNNMERFEKLKSWIASLPRDGAETPAKN